MTTTDASSLPETLSTSGTSTTTTRLSSPSTTSSATTLAQHPKHLLGVVSIPRVLLVFFCLIIVRNELGSHPTTGLFVKAPISNDCNTIRAAHDRANKNYNPRYTNVLLLGQFNYDMDAELVLKWVDKWRHVFQHVQIRGPFRAANLVALKTAGVEAYWGENDEGFYSPMKNMAKTLRMYTNAQDVILGVLQVHDDLLVNLTQLEALGFPSATQILNQAPPTVMAQPSMYFSTHTTEWRVAANKAWRPANYDPGHWRWWRYCLKPFSGAVTMDPVRSEQYAHVDKSDNATVVPLYANAVGDFQYVPTIYAKAYADMADWLVTHEVFLECGTPTIHAHLRQTFNASIQFVQYCTTFEKVRDNYTAWVRPHCVEGGYHYGVYYPQKYNSSAPFGIVHPVKMRTHGFDTWSNYFDLVLGIPTSSSS